MTFNIQTNEVKGSFKTVGEISFGGHRENFPLITTRWSREAYESKWVQALVELVEGRVKSCVLVTDIQPPKQSSGITYWALFREENFVHLQERFSRDLVAQLEGSAINAEQHIPPRKQGTPEEQAQVSEWTVPIGDVFQFVERARKSEQGK